MAAGTVGYRSGLYARDKLLKSGYYIGACLGSVSDLIFSKLSMHLLQHLCPFLWSTGCCFYQTLFETTLILYPFFILLFLVCALCRVPASQVFNHEGILMHT